MGRCVHAIMRDWLHTDPVEHRSGAWCLLSHLRNFHVGNHSPTGQFRGDHSPSHIHALQVVIDQFLLTDIVYTIVQSLIRIELPLMLPCLHTYLNLNNLRHSSYTNFKRQIISSYLESNCIKLNPERKYGRVHCGAHWRYVRVIILFFSFCLGSTSVSLQDIHIIVWNVV